MGWWGWRLAVIMICMCVSLILLACAATTTTPVLTPTEIAPITLTVWLTSTASLFTPLLAVTTTPQPLAIQPPQSITYLVHPGDTLNDVAQNFGIEPDALQAANPQLGGGGLTVYGWLVIPISQPTQTPQPLDVTAPECYLTPADEYICLGLIRNAGSNSVTRVSVQVALVAPDGSYITGTTAGVEQRHILSGGSAPYRVLFPRSRLNADPLSTATVSHTTAATTVNRQPSALPPSAARVIQQSQLILSLRSADAVPLEATFLPLTLEHTLENSDDTARKAAQVAVRIYNPTDQMTSRLRVVVCLFDGGERLIGYRVLDLEGLQPEETRPVAVDVQPMTEAEELTYTVYAEALSN